MLLVQLFTVLGFIVSWYAYTVERNVKINATYKAWCDLKESMSCTQAFASQAGHLFGISNAVGGLFFYALLFVLTFFASSEVIFYLALVAFWGTMYLAYVSYVKMRNFCVVCTVIYIINIFLLIFATRVLLAA